MKTKRILGAITAIAMSASAFAGLGCVASAYEELTDYAIDEISTWTLSDSSYLSNKQVDYFYDLNGNEQTVYAVYQTNKNAYRPASYYLNSKIVPGDDQVLQLDFTLGMSCGNHGTAYLDIMGTATAIANATNYESSSISYFGMPKQQKYVYINGSSEACNIQGDATQKSATYYGRTYLTPVRARMDFNNHTIEISIADASGDYSVEYSDAMIDTSVTGFYGFIANPEQYGSVSITDVSLTLLDKPVLELKETEATITEADGTANVEVSSLTGSITDVSSTNTSVVTGEYDNGNIVLTGQGTSGTATVTVTAENDGLTTTQDIKVTVGQTSTTTVKVYFKDSTGTITLHEPVEIEDVTVTGTLDLTDVDEINYVEYVDSTYTDTTTGIIYDVTAPTDTTYSPVEEDGEFTLYYTLTEQTYAATVTTVKNADVTISGESTLGEEVSKTIVSSYLGVASFTGIPAGTSYTVTVSKNGYTDGTTTIDVSSDEENNTATISTLTPEKDYVLYQETIDSTHMNLVSASHQYQSGLNITGNIDESIGFDMNGKTADKYKVTIDSIAFLTSGNSASADRAISVSLRDSDENVLSSIKGTQATDNTSITSATITAGDTSEELSSGFSGEWIIEVDTTTKENNITVTFNDIVYTGSIDASDVAELYIYSTDGGRARVTLASSITVEDAAPRIDGVTVAEAVTASESTPALTEGTTLYGVDGVDDSTAKGTETVTTYTIQVANYASSLGLPSLTFEDNIEEGVENKTLAPAVTDTTNPYYYTSNGYYYFVIQTIGIDAVAESASLTDDYTYTIEQ